MEDLLFLQKQTNLLEQKNGFLKDVHQRKLLIISFPQRIGLKIGHIDMDIPQKETHQEGIN